MVNLIRNYLFFFSLYLKVGPLASYYQVPLRHILLVCAPFIFALQKVKIMPLLLEMFSDLIIMYLLFMVDS